MNFRIDPSELVARPGARERILRAGEAYQARLANHPFRKITIRCESDEAYEAAALASENARQASDRLSLFILTALATFGRPAPLCGEESNRILDEVAAKHGVTVKDLQGPRRMPIYARARQEAMYRLHNERRNLSLPMIGRMLNRDHTTVIHGIRRHRELNSVTNPERQVAE